MIENTGLLLTVMGIYMIGILIIGWVAGKKNSSTSSDYMVAGGRMSGWLTTATLLATFICGGTVMGGAGTAYSDGLRATIPDPFGAALCLVAGGLFYLKVIRKTSAKSAGSVYANRFGNTGAAVASLCMIPTFVFFGASQIAAAGKVFQIILGWDFVTMALISGIIIVVYTYMGGITAVAWTDFVQIAILVIGVIILYPMVLGQLDTVGGTQAAVNLMGSDFFSFAPEPGTFTFVGILTYLALWIGTSAGAIPGCDLIQRSLVARTGNTAKWSGVASGVIMAVIGLLVVLIGAWANLLTDTGFISASNAAAISEDGELLIPLLASQLMHPWVLAIFLSGLLGAIMSSADSALFAPATIVSNDLIRPLVERAGKTYEDNDLTKWTKWSVLGIGFLSIILGIYTQSVFDLMITGFTVQGGMLFFPLTLALYWKKANKWGGIAGMVTGGAVTFGMMIAQGTVYPEPYWALVFMPMIISGLTVVVVSLATQKSCPPVALTDANTHKAVKWGDLQHSYDEKAIG